MTLSSPSVLDDNADAPRMGIRDDTLSAPEAADAAPASPPNPNRASVTWLPDLISPPPSTMRRGAGEGGGERRHLLLRASDPRLATPACASSPQSLGGWTESEIGSPRWLELEEEEEEREKRDDEAQLYEVV